MICDLAFPGFEGKARAGQQEHRQAYVLDGRVSCGNEQDPIRPTGAWLVEVLGVIAQFHPIYCISLMDALCPVRQGINALVPLLRETEVRQAQDP